MSGAANDLADKLRRYYAAAPTGKKALSIHLFGIENAEALRSVSKNDVAELAGLSRTYGTELNKAVNLAEYVSVAKRLV